MSEPIKKPIHTSPQSYKPEAPKMIKLLEETRIEISKQQPKIVMEHIHCEEFYFLGKEYPRNWYTIRGFDVWGDFDKSGGWGMVTKYRNNPSYNCTVVNHLINPAGIYMAGTFVDKMNEVPEGFTLKKFPSYEYIVVTHEWMPNWNLGIVEEAVKSVQIPDGYIKFDNDGSQIRLIEVENNDPEKGSRWENWIPIKKV
jgi:hypothetical protein